MRICSLVKPRVPQVVAGPVREPSPSLSAAEDLILTSRVNGRPRFTFQPRCRNLHVERLRHQRDGRDPRMGGRRY